MSEKANPNVQVSLCRLQRLLQHLPPHQRTDGHLALENLVRELGLPGLLALEAGLTARQQQLLAKPQWPAAPVPMLQGSTKREMWFNLLRQAEADPICSRHLRPNCKLVVGTGPLDADVMFVGEAPGAEEELKGIPFVGAAGKELDLGICSAGFQRDAAYITNILPWRPPTKDGKGNRPPTQDEIAYCLGFLQAQIKIVQPKVIVALGATACCGLLGEEVQITKVRGQTRNLGGLPVVLTYHPSYVLRIGTAQIRHIFAQDIQLAFSRAT